MVAEKKICTGSAPQEVGALKTIDTCHDRCKGKASMFSYGVGEGGCNSRGCLCICEITSKEGQCTMTDSDRFNLYAYPLEKTGEIRILFFLY